ncbi:nitrogen fixation protein NifU [Sulfurovum lithotrophicum]|uniref:Nitrogen fixation protein NifU n=1 Tax=Sulfurovum lithotrophicum TaxID=206403 RepID=A0A7U4RQR9_9BACT|nr:NifU family protein [Sulfurovum lithotrophicum]AKF25095.1 nitrogen fixation protein NifU [Sulfurovum lithotrophicum]
MTFNDQDIYQAVKHHLPSVNEYVESHGGAIKLLGVKNGTVYIELTGTCHGCSMSLMTTKMVVQKKLRELIHPELNVVNVDGTPENTLPDDCYTEEDTEEEKIEDKEGLFDKIKKYF